MSNFRKILCVCVMAAVLVMAFPVSSLAVDPVSAATMANAFAQAITAYGASQGVSMTFDVANTDGIGEGVHDLWEQYADDMAQSNVTVSDYSNLAASVFPTLWKKTFDYVSVSLDAATVGEIDGFWNWLLSGPAEMVKVDNEYYEFSSSQIGANAIPISIYSWSSVPTIPLLANYGANAATFNLSINKYVAYNSYYNVFNSGTANSTVYMFHTDYGNNYTQIYAVSASYFEAQQISKNQYGSYTLRSSGTSASYDSNYGYYFATIGNLSNNDIESINSPYYASVNDAITAIYGGSISSDIGIMQYVGDTTPERIYIPDNTDVNYTPVAAEIPLDILWDDTLFGDGTDTLTDAQSEAITQAADQAITDNPAKTLELADTINPPAPSPSEVYIPFLPVTLPSFQFSLSGIWHYVTAWVASLGAWFSLVFTTWSYLPYAISVPVYATAVIVIVLGVYKRFFM